MSRGALCKVATRNVEFPDWSGHIPFPYWAETVDEMDLRSEAMLHLVKAHPDYLQRRLAEKIDVPFEL